MWKTEIKILNLNLKAYDSEHSQKERLQAVADFCNNNFVDVLLLQEGTWGLFGGNSIIKLKNMLYNDYYYYQEPCFGIWGMYQFQCGILSSKAKIREDSIRCKIKSNSWIDSIPLPGSKRIISMTTLCYGKEISFINCHLDSNPKNEEEREKQLESLASYIFNKEISSDYVVIGGDFNTSLENVKKHFYGYRNLIWNQTDGIFTNYEGKCESRVVFDDFVSDHRGLLTTIDF